MYHKAAAKPHSRLSVICMKWQECLILKNELINRECRDCFVTRLVIHCKDFQWSEEQTKNVWNFWWNRCAGPCRYSSLMANQEKNMAEDLTKIPTQLKLSTWEKAFAFFDETKTPKKFHHKRECSKNTLIFLQGIHCSKFAVLLITGIHTWNDRLTQTTSWQMKVCKIAWCTYIAGEHVCIPNPCENGGTCIAWGEEFTCTCAPGFRGKTCSKGEQLA